MKKKYTYVQFYTLGICLFFFIFYFNLRNYGLPYFVNFDETAHIKSINYFYGFFSNANQDIVEPIYSPLLHFLVTGTIFLIKFIIFSSYSLSEFKDLVFLNPDLLWSYTRLSSLIFSTLSIYLIFLISKKLKISNSFIFLSVTSISLSFFFADISISAGKNAILLFLFLLQYYFFLKYFFKINKFNSKAYIVIAILSTLAWGVNYWAATPGIYSIAILHYKKFSYSKLNKLIPFMIIFIFFGIFTNYIISADKIFHHLFNPEYLAVTDYNEHSSSNRFMIFLDEIIIGINIIRNYEKILLEVFLILFLFVIIVKTRIDKKIIFFNLILISEPLFLFAIADYSHPAIRYFGPTISMIFITSSYIISNSSFKNSKINTVLKVSFFLILSIPIYEKYILFNKVGNILKTDYIQYDIFKDYKDKGKTIYNMPNYVYRENIENLNLYKNLLKLNLIKNNPDAGGKNTKEKIENKIQIINSAAKNNIFPSSKKLIFFGGEFLIINLEKFFDYIEKDYDYYVIYENINAKEFKYLKNNYEILDEYRANDLAAFRQITISFRDGYNQSTIDKIIKIGSNFVVFNLKNKKF
jgi:hypothetical protein